MDNEVVIKVTSKNDVRPGFEAAKKDAENAGRDMGKAMGGKVSDEFMAKMRAAFSEMPEKTGAAAVGDKIGKDIGEHVSEGMSRAIGRAKVPLLSTDGQTARIKVDVDVDRDSFGSRLKSMFATTVPNALNGAMGSIGNAFSAAFSGDTTKVIIVTAIVSALTPIISGAIASATALAIGGGVLAGGIALAANNPAVRGAFGDLKDHLMDKDLKPLQTNVTKAQAKLTKAQALGKGIDSAEYDLALAEKALTKAREFNRLNESLRDMASVFVAPLARAAKTLADGVDRMKPDIKELFNTMAPVLDKLTPGLVGLFEQMMPGVKKLAEASVPLFEKLAEWLPVIGYALGDFFTKIAENGDDTTEFFEDLLKVIVSLIDWIGSAVVAFTSFYVKVKHAALLFTSVLVGYFREILHAAVLAFGWMPGIGPKLRAAERQFAAFQRNVNSELFKIKDRSVKIHVSAVGVAAAKAAIQGAAIIARSMGRAHGGVVGAAAGGARSGLTWVGEQGPELVDLPAGATVHTAGDSRRIAAGMGGQQAPIVIQMIPTVDQGLISAIMRSLRIEIGNQGGNVQAVLGRA